MFYTSLPECLWLLIPWANRVLHNLIKDFVFWVACLKDSFSSADTHELTKYINYTLALWHPFMVQCSFSMFGTNMFISREKVMYFQCTFMHLSLLIFPAVILLRFFRSYHYLSLTYQCIFKMFSLAFNSLNFIFQSRPMQCLLFSSILVSCTISNVIPTIFP